MKYFTLQELWKSATATRKGINNQPNGEASRRLRDLVTFVLTAIAVVIGWGVIKLRVKS